MIRSGVTTERYLYQVERDSRSMAVGTLRPIVTTAVVSGMENVEAAVFPMGVSGIPTDLGILSSEAFSITVDAEQLGANEIREGDRFKQNGGGPTYVVISAELVQDRVWKCFAQKKKA
jgi:hypothetical protein